MLRESGFWLRVGVGVDHIAVSSESSVLAFGAVGGGRDSALAAGGAESLSEVARGIDVHPVAGLSLADAKAACEVGTDGHRETRRDACAPADDDTWVAAMEVEGPAASPRDVKAGSRAEFFEQVIDYAGGACHVAGRACREDLADSFRERCQRVCLVLGEGRPVVVALEHRANGVSPVAGRRRLYLPGAVMPRCQRVDQTTRDVGDYPHVTVEMYAVLATLGGGRGPRLQ
jgi:hypothetical protein